MHVDMDQRSLSFAIGDKETPAEHAIPVDAQVILPRAVRPWVLLAHRDDAVTLVGYRGPALIRSAVAAEEWLRLSLPPTVREHERSAKLSRDLFAHAVARDLLALSRLGLLTEAMLSLLCHAFEVAPSGSALLGRLIALHIIAPLGPRSSHFCCPSGLSANTAKEPLYIAPCLLPAAGAPPQRLLSDPPTAFECVLTFHQRASTTPHANAAAAGFALEAEGTGSTAHVLHTPPLALPPVLWTVLLNRCLLASELVGGHRDDLEPPHLTAHWALFPFGEAIVEVRKTSLSQVTLGIWASSRCLALMLGTVAVHAAALARMGASSADGAAWTSDALVPRLTPRAAGGAPSIRRRRGARPRPCARGVARTPARAAPQDGRGGPTRRPRTVGSSP